MADRPSQRTKRWLVIPLGGLAVALIVIGLIGGAKSVASFDLAGIATAVLIVVTQIPILRYAQRKYVENHPIQVRDIDE